MSAPYIYQPPATYGQPSPYGARFDETPYYVPNTPNRRPTTPFIPDAAQYPPSPYSRPSSHQGSPYRGAAPLPRADAPERYAFPRAGSAYDAGYDVPPWDYARERRPSWHGENQSPWPGAPPTSAPAYGYGTAHSAAGYGRERRHSFNAAGYPQPYAPLRINPLLNGEVPNLNFFFNLAARYTPLLMYGRGDPIPLPAEELAQPATYPPIMRMRIRCDVLPKEWFLDIELPPEQLDSYTSAGYDPPPITVSDVLSSLHRHLHRLVSHAEWGQLPQMAMDDVSRAFSRRCLMSGGREGYHEEVSQGVRRVDYLKGKTRLLGLLRAGTEEGFEIMKLVTGDLTEARV